MSLSLLQIEAGFQPEKSRSISRLDDSRSASCVYE
jgi:hypothetical protein